jgi:hypothetical protein
MSATIQGRLIGALRNSGISRDRAARVGGYQTPARA